MNIKIDWNTIVPLILLVGTLSIMFWVVYLMFMRNII